jgi:hypothetical protein
MRRPTPVWRFAVGCAAITLAGCASGTPAQTVKVGGHHATLVDADPCMWNGDSGCTDHSLGGRDSSVCLDGVDALALDAGAQAAGATATAGRRGDHQWLGRSIPKGRIKLAVHRLGEGRFSISLPAELPPDLRVLHIDIRYGDGVLTPYQPFDEQWDTGASPKAFKRGVYAVRIRTAPVGDCRPAS